MGVLAKPTNEPGYTARANGGIPNFNGNVWYLLSMLDFWGVSCFVGSKSRFKGVRMSCFLLRKLKGKEVILDESKYG